MHFSTIIPLWALTIGHVIAFPAFEKAVEKRNAPAACASPLAVSLAYDVLNLFHETSFCSQWLSISTVTTSG
jgi:hypothetical protein